MKIDPNAPAYPIDATVMAMRNVDDTELQNGLPIRAVIAKDLLVGMLSDQRNGSIISMMSRESMIREAVVWADALIEELNKDTPNEK